MEFNPETESWTKIGTMKRSRYYHAVSVVPFDDFAKWCNYPEGNRKGRIYILNILNSMGMGMDRPFTYAFKGIH